MVQTDSNVTTRLQSRIDSQDGKIDALSTQLRDLTSVVTSIKEFLGDLPKTVEKMVQGHQRADGKQHMYEEVINETFIDPSIGSPSGSGATNPHNNSERRFDPSLFSLPKVKLPLFEGTDPRGWITKAELYFEVNRTPVTTKMYLAQMCMDGIALNWYTNLLIKHPQTDWIQFRGKLLVRFGGTRFHNAHEALGSLDQEGDIEAYIEEFEAISALIPDQSEDQSVGMFLRGLQPEIKNWVRALHPTTCDQAMEFARHVAQATASSGEKGGSKGKGTFGGSSNWAPPWKQPIRYSSAQSSQSPKPTSAAQSFTRPGIVPKQTNPNTIQTKHLTKQEWEERRRKGLCFSCGQKYTPQHKCTEGQFRIMLLGDGDELDDDGEVIRAEEVHDLNDQSEGECHALDSNGVTSDTTPLLKTIKLLGELNGYSALILVDSGASHNFLSKQLALALGFDIETIPRVGIRLGDGSQVLITEMCRNIAIRFGNFSFVIDALVYELGSLDAILGIAWLGKLGDVVFNWQKSEIRFWDQGIPITLHHSTGGFYFSSRICLTPRLSRSLQSQSFTHLL